MFIASFRLKNFIQRLLCDLREVVDFPGMHPTREMERIALTETVQYIREHMSEAVGFYTPSQVLEYALRHAKGDGHFLEFGVYKGGSIRFIAKCIGSQVVYGFDSFEGLPENWVGYRLDKNAFTTRGKLPKIPSNVQLYPGWFDKTLPQWLDKHPGPVSFVHIDCDLYSSTKTVFDLLTPRIQQGTTIVFDEYFNYPNWQNHEYKAFQEFVDRHNVKYQYLCYARIQVAVKIDSISHNSA